MRDFLSDTNDKIYKINNKLIDPIITDIENNATSLKHFNSYYRYCKNINGAYQSFEVDIYELVRRNDRIKELWNNDDKLKAIKSQSFLRKRIEKMNLYIKAYNIQQAYKICEKDETIKVFSHRESGWSNPEYNLNENFRVNVNTNFGFGRSSYFYILLKYKNITISPFSKWIHYKIANTHDIIRFTKSYTQHYNYHGPSTRVIDNPWPSAIKFLLKACNLCLESEEKFIEKYVIDEIQEMVDELKKIFNNSDFELFEEATQKKRKSYSLDGHDLVEYRGEKISGALDFVDKIMEFENIINVKKFIKTIKDQCLDMNPILKNESELIKEELVEHIKSFEEIEPVYTKQNKIYEEHLSNIYTLSDKFYGKFIMEEEDIEDEILENYKKQYPEFEKFKQEYKEIEEKYKHLKNNIAILKYTNHKIKEHYLKIDNFFLEND